MRLKLLKKNKTFSGETCFYEHASEVTQTNMKFSAFLPGDRSQIQNCIIWLSGLTCTEENFITKAGAQQFLDGTNTMIICPDTSPRGLNLPGEHVSYDFGSGASFYVNATSPGYCDHYRMYDYIAKELVSIIRSDFGAKKISIMGHSMGGHGALVLGLREQDTFVCVSAFSPIVNPIAVDWGEKAFHGYLGENKEEWKKYDATEIIRSGVSRKDTLLIDQGLSDEFLEKQLLTQHLVDVAKKSGQKVIVHFREGYDHSYFFISTFIKEHLEFHLKAFLMRETEIN